MILFSHPTGNANVRAAALGLHRAGVLGEFWTCLNHRPSFFARLLPGGMRTQLARRSFPAEIQPLIHSHPVREAARLAAHRLGFDSLTRHERGPLSVDAVYRSLDIQVARRVRTGNFSAVYAYEDGAAFTFREARNRGVSAFYDLPIGYWRAARDLLTEEAERQPAWAGTLIGNADSPAKTARKDEELALADRIYVASSFTKQTLDRYPGTLRGPVQIIPYGAPQRVSDSYTTSTISTIQAATSSSPNRPLRVLFVGSLGQRKGLSYLFEACRKLGTSVSLTVIGECPLTPCAALDTELARPGVHWIRSCPHVEVLTAMAAHDVFVFPSLFEGFGLVLLEAMAMGLPIIATPHTAAPDLITDGEEGFIIPIRSADAIAEKLDLLRRTPDLRATMSRRAAARAAAFTWESYGSQLSTSVAEMPLATESRRSTESGREVGIRN